MAEGRGVATAGGGREISGAYGAGFSRRDTGIASPGAGVFDELGKQFVGTSSPSRAPGPLDNIPMSPANAAGLAASNASGANLTPQAPNNIAPSALTPAMNTPANPVDELPNLKAMRRLQIPAKVTPPPPVVYMN
jgi:hypothetical protein